MKRLSRIRYLIFKAVLITGLVAVAGCMPVPAQLDTMQSSQSVTSTPTITGSSTLALQTAGYSGQAVAEIRIEGIVHAEELRELIRSMVRQSGQGADNDGTGGRAPVQSATGSMSTNLLMLDELKKIRLLLEQKIK